MGRKEQYDQIDFQYILEERIGSGKYQLFNSASVFIACQLEGIEVVMITIILPVLIE